MDDDLGDVLRHLNRHSRQAQRQLANHPLTRAYLEAGLRLLAEEFHPKPTDDDERPLQRSFLRISREQVIKEVAHGPADLPQQGNPGSLRDRWPYFSDYLGDLILYALRIDGFGAHLELARQAVDAIGGDDTASNVAHEISYRQLALKIDETATRFHLLVTAFADHDPVVGSALSSVYREMTNTWRAVYEEIFRAWGLRLRPGLSLDDFTVITIAMVEGLVLRTLGDRSTPVLDHQRRRSLLGTAVLALLVAFVDPGDGQTLEDIANQLANGEARPGSAPQT